MHLSKSMRVGGLALLIFAVVIAGRLVGGSLSVWDPESDELRMRVLFAPAAFVFGTILIVAGVKDGEKHLSKGGAQGAVFLMLFIAVAFLSVLLDIGSWGSS